MSEKQNVSRRKVIKQASLVLGFTISGPTLTGVLSGCKSPSSPDWQPRYLTREEIKLVDAISSRILPSGNTPGAADAEVSKFIDQMVGEFYLGKDQQRFRAGLEVLEAQSQAIIEKSFIAASESEQDKVLSEQVALARQQLTAAPQDPQPFFLMIKELTVLGFFSSEIGATQVLKFDEIPGGFQGCAPLDEVGGKTWATA